MCLKLFLLMIYMKSLQFNLCVTFAVHPDVEQEVNIGKNAVLHCPSNDRDHNFMFWQLADAQRSVIGPGNAYNRNKYEYEVLTGKLIIKKVSPEEDGVLNCVSKGVRTDDISIRTVRMIVKRDWEEVYEEDPSINALRVFIALGMLIIIVGGGYLLYRNWRSKQDMQLFLGEDEDDESNDELFSQPGPSYRFPRSRTPSPSSPPSPFRHSIDSASAASFKSFASDVTLESDNIDKTKQPAKKGTKSDDLFDPFGDDEPNFNF